MWAPFEKLHSKSPLPNATNGNNSNSGRKIDGNLLSPEIGFVVGFETVVTSEISLETHVFGAIFGWPDLNHQSSDSDETSGVPIAGESSSVRGGTSSELGGSSGGGAVELQQKFPPNPLHCHCSFAEQLAATMPDAPTCCDRKTPTKPRLQPPSRFAAPHQRKSDPKFALSERKIVRRFLLRRPINSPSLLLNSSRLHLSFLTTLGL
ncbi:hypothetical protein PanWU01x14_362970 [Parasponia andersonii]|uniref:Uncharacterized protein n=1 Tax=Parasponia andersonii TaxID=3476 RepID=A0A2P5A6S3_PARAD|nr:hypothetical protein PanWU01x14_362970 [Parasponia andersonii]